MPIERKSARGRARTAPPGLVWSAILILYVVWGSTYLGIRIAVESMPPFVMAGVRFGIAGLVLLVAVTVARRRLPRVSLREMRDSFIVAAFLLGGGMGAVAWGEQTVPSGIAALMVAMMPAWIALGGRAFFGERLPVMAGFGIFAGIAGVAILVGPSMAIDGSLDPAGVAALIVSPLSWATGSLFSAHRARLPEDPIVATGLQMVFGCLVLSVVALISGELGAFRIEQVSADSLIAFAYLTIVGSLIAFTAYAWVLRHAPLPLIATYAFVNPVVAVFLGWMVLGEAVTPIQLIAATVIVVGVALIITSRSRMSATPSTERGGQHRPVATEDLDSAAA
jgi:drug/metabolite transporter (DMT)-like permease